MDTTMIGLFDDTTEAQPPHAHRPLAERVRPMTLDGIEGQEHLLGDDGPFQAFVRTGRLPSMILWGPPGTGKTTLANALAATAGIALMRLSAIDAGVKELREILAKAGTSVRRERRTVVFVDEIHRFNKGQQDALLHAVEEGTVTLIGATTENPSFEINAALLSRCQVYRLHSLTDETIRTIVEHAISKDETLGGVIVEDWTTLATIAGGDARTALNAIETAASIATVNDDGTRTITHELLVRALQRTVVRYDKSGEQHYDIISAFIKSLRGSDPDAALFWLAVMIEAGEDALFIARRMVVFASEDVGNADPSALALAVSVFQAVERIGMPEGRIPLAQGVTYLALAQKSNASYMAINAAIQSVRSTGTITVPMHLRNAPTKLTKQEGYGVGYQYPHNHDQHFVRENYFPEEIQGQSFYRPDSQEPHQKARLNALWPERTPKDTHPS
ncbi:MAG: replication-associated recombination protein A [Candidatus Kapabacteria bacterium]|nr:replication-associated recombination protein A [Candidatus Kapabacteria bacterium]